MNSAYSIDIIGGADGPTAVFITGSFLPELILFLIACLGVLIWSHIKKK
jgi:Na+-transporting methylmalonyl-CoA/oxaloacetate decarboxylase beta subunit